MSMCTPLCVIGLWIDQLIKVLQRSSDFLWLWAIKTICMFQTLGISAELWRYQFHQNLSKQANRNQWAFTPTYYYNSKLIIQLKIAKSLPRILCGDLWRKSSKGSSNKRFWEADPQPEYPVTATVTVKMEQQPTLLECTELLWQERWLWPLSHLFA